MPRTYGVNYILNKVYKELAFEGAWKDTFGVPSDPFTMLVYGHPKNGKTDFMMKLGKYLTKFGKVFYSSIEEGENKTVQEAFRRNDMQEVAGKFMLGEGYFFNDLVEYLKGRDRGRFVIIDSRDYMNLTSVQFKKLVTLFPHKSFIVVCWERSGKPKGQFAQDIEYMVDIVTHVHDFRGRARGRFGGFKEFVIWDKKPSAGDQLKLAVA